MPQSAILFHNPEETVFLIDIPTSISLAQGVSPNQRRLPPDRQKQIFSSVPLAEPFPSSTEPKTDTARSRVLERIPPSERVFHTETIEPLVRDGLEVIRHGVLKAQGNWCYARKVFDRALPKETHLGKRRRAESRDAGTFFPDDCLAGDGTREFENDPRAGADDTPQPPLVLSSSSTNAFGSLDELRGVLVKNTSLDAADLSVQCRGEKGLSYAAEIDLHHQHHYHAFVVPPLSVFVLCRLPIAQSPDQSPTGPIPGIPQGRKFNLILLDPPWNNRSVRRGGQYHTQHYSESDMLTQYLQYVLQRHLYDPLVSNRTEESRAVTTRSIAAIWITNSPKARKTAYDALRGAGLSVCEEWAWIKTTISGEPVTPVDGLWRKPYEILIIGEKIGQNQRRDPIRRVIAAVPDFHSRKPNLKEIFERLFFGGCAEHPYDALEVFARNLTAGWWACGDEVLKFNAQEWWTEQSIS